MKSLMNWNLDTTTPTNELVKIILISYGTLSSSRFNKSKQRYHLPFFRKWWRQKVQQCTVAWYYVVVHLHDNRNMLSKLGLLMSDPDFYIRLSTDSASSAIVTMAMVPESPESSTINSSVTKLQPRRETSLPCQHSTFDHWYCLPTQANTMPRKVLWTTNTTRLTILYICWNLEDLSHQNHQHKNFALLPYTDCHTTCICMLGKANNKIDKI